MDTKKFNTIDLFAGCGGLMDGFMQEGGFDTLACVEWETFPCQTLANRLEKRWHHMHAKEEVVRFDIQRTDELINGFDDEKFGKHIGLKRLIGNKRIDVVIGGPPCQGFSNANRQKNHAISQNNMLVKQFIRAIRELQPKAFVMENVSMLRSEVHRFYLDENDA